jgi:hypothetical protein
MPDRVPAFRVSLANATLLSAAYLLVAAAVEALRRTYNWRWVERLALALEAFPARLLKFFGLLEPLRRAWVEGAISDLQVRLIYGVTVVGLIYALGLVVGLLLAAIVRHTEREDASGE